ncbi:uncharacterized protein LOC119677435 [Teleopsis dalmanni]|uniref:uncharacterized protein LOC119677435 n=1 Tax=Teleopsis dalmanni TaxID=139649 RepID=UPI0018CFB465|nr:uncharacterized protein LOC119677435 [Teleopsis dalmanni]
MSNRSQNKNKMAFVKLRPMDVVVLAAVTILAAAALIPNVKGTKTDNLIESTEKNGNSGKAASFEPFLGSTTDMRRMKYETIHRILRDENEPAYRNEEKELRYYQMLSYHPTHEILRRSINEETQIETEEVLNLTRKDLNKFFVETFETYNLSAITEIDLSFNKIQALNLTELRNLQKADLSHNLLTSLPLNDSSSIVSLNLNNNHIKSSINNTNTKLRELYLSSNDLESLSVLNISLFSVLETLDLSCNKIKNLESSFFPQRMLNLKHLNLAHNQLDSIYRETFYNLLSLNTLLLSYNNITDIDYETFLALPNLQFLDLSHNRLKGEAIRALQGIPDLVRLSIAYNTDLGPSMQEFVASWSLKELDASGTGLCQIPAALAQSVRTLKLSDNWLKSINCGDLDSYPLLQYLDLSYSKVEDIEDDALGRLEILEVLFLDHNKLRKVPLSLPTSLEHLFLHNNEIMDIQAQAFQGLNYLQTLDLSGNKLLYIPALTLPKLTTLNLQSAGIKTINQAIIHTLPHLKDLLLEDNPIRCSDLLGIAEWASPCRITEHTGSTTSELTDFHLEQQIVGTNMGQQQIHDSQKQQLQQQHQQQQQQQQQPQQIIIPKNVNLKQKFLQTYNFFEKFKSICNQRASNPKISVLAMETTPPPPLCAIKAYVKKESRNADNSKMEPTQKTKVVTFNLIQNTTGNFSSEITKNKKLSEIYQNFFDSTKLKNSDESAEMMLHNVNAIRSAASMNFSTNTTDSALKTATPAASKTILNEKQILNLSPILSTISSVVTEAYKKSSYHMESVSKEPYNNVVTENNADTKPDTTASPSVDVPLHAQNLQELQPITSEPVSLNNNETIPKPQTMKTTTNVTPVSSFKPNNTPSTTINEAIHMPQTVSNMSIKSSNNYVETTTLLSQKGSKTPAANTAATQYLKIQTTNIENMPITTTPAITGTATTAALPTTNLATTAIIKPSTDKSLVSKDSNKIVENTEKNTSIKGANSESNIKFGQQNIIDAVTERANTMPTITTTATRYLTTILKQTKHQRKPLPTKISTNSMQSLLISAAQVATEPTERPFIPTTSTASTFRKPIATTPIHKHEPLQLHVKDRHLIGTPLLMHKGENILVDGEQLLLPVKATPPASKPKTTMSTIKTLNKEETIYSPLNMEYHGQNVDTERNEGNEAAILAKSQYAANELKETKWLRDITGLTEADEDEPQMKLNERIAQATSGHYAELKEFMESTSEETKPNLQEKKIENRKKPTLIMKKMTVIKHANPQKQHHYVNTPRENEAHVPHFHDKIFEELKPATGPVDLSVNSINYKHNTLNTPIKGLLYEVDSISEHRELYPKEEMQAHTALPNSESMLKSEQWLDIRKATTSAHPGLVILLSFILFVVLLVGLIHVYRCDMPWRRNLHQQRPHQRHLNEDESNSFLNYQTNHQSLNVHKWHHSTRLQPPYNSPLHNLHVRELQKTTPIDDKSNLCKQFYNSSLGASYNTNTNNDYSYSSSISSSRSSTALEDDSFYIEMTPDSGQPADTLHSDLLPMELLGVSHKKNKTDHATDILTDSSGGLSVNSYNVPAAIITTEISTTNAKALSLSTQSPSSMTNGIGLTNNENTKNGHKASTKQPPPTRKFDLW